MHGGRDNDLSANLFGFRETRVRLISGTNRISQGITYQKEGEWMKIGFAGAGKVGFTLGKYMSGKGVCISGYYSKSRESARQASEFVQTRCFETLEDLVKSSDALFLTVPDGTIKEVWDSLKKFDLTDKFICHCSGVMTSAVFSEIDRTGASGYSIHPLFAVNDRLQSYQEISKAYFTIEGEEKYLDFWRKFLEDLGNPVRILRPEQKILYHSAAVFVSNLAVGLYETGANLLMECGFDRESAEAALEPLFVNNCMAVARKGTKDALTGPVERADIKTIEKHLQVLEGNEKEIYLSLSKVLTEIAGRKNPQRDYSELSELFNGTV